LNVPDATGGFWGDGSREGGRDAAPLAGFIIDDEYGNDRGTAEASFGSLENPRVTFPWIIGGAVIWNTPFDGLRFGSTFMHGRYHVQASLRYDVEIPEGFNGAGYHPFVQEIDETADINHLATFSAEFVHDDLTLAAEYYTDRFEEAKSIGWYVQSDYRFSRLFSLCAYYADLSPFEGNQEKEALEALGSPDYYRWQRDFTISTRFDLTEFWLFKLEYHFMDGVAGTIPSSLLEDQGDPKKRNWGMFAAKATFHF
jgi:hypothetical protein